MWLREEFQSIKKVLSVYYPKDGAYRAFIVFDVASMGLLLYLFGILVERKLPTILALVIALFTFTITNAFPSLYESYKLDVKKITDKAKITTNKRKLTVFGNVLNTVVIATVIIELFAYSKIPPIVVGGIIIFVYIVAGIAGIFVHNLKKAESTNKEKT